MAAHVTAFFEAQAGCPNLAYWPNGTKTVTIWAKVSDPVSDVTYRICPYLYRGQNQGSANAAWHSSEPEPQALTTSWALYTFTIPVRELTGPTSDRCFLFIVGTGGINAGGTIHIGGDGGDNQTRIVDAFETVPARPQSLQRNPDSDRPSNTVTFGPGGSSRIFFSLAGDPGLVVWPARVWRLRIYAAVNAGSATLTATLARSSGAILADDVTVGTITATSPTLVKVDVDVPESWGTVDDTIVCGLRGACPEGTTLTVSIGLDHPSSLNAPLVPPPGGTTTSPTSDDKTRVESGGTRGFLRELTASSDGSILVGVASGRLDLKVGSIPETAFADATRVSVIIVMPSTSTGAKLPGARFRYAGGGIFNGVDSTGFVAGQEVCVFFDVRDGEVLTLGHNQTPPFGFPSSARFLLKGSPSSGKLIKSPLFVSFRLDTWSATPGWREL
jgi:hypothetical protein